MDNKGVMVNINRVLNCINLSIKDSNIKNFKDLIHVTHRIQNRELLRICYNNSDIELICFICKCNRKKHLKYLLYESNVLHYLTIDNKSREMKYREDSFYYAMRSNIFNTLEMLYDYWSGDLHWLGHKKEHNKLDIENLEQLNTLLKSAFNRYQKYIQLKRKICPETIFNIESLMAFNAFQIELYAELNILKYGLSWEDKPADITRINETNVIKSTILAVFKIYEKYSKQSLLGNSVLELNEKNMDGYLDNTSLIYRTRLYAIYEVFFRKLDYNFCLLILDNLHLLKLRLSMSKNSYQKVESKLYYFIYHISTKWNLYFPRRKNYKSIKIFKLFKEKLCCFSINYNDQLQYIYNTIYLERRDFETVMKCFKKELLNINLEENIREGRIELPNEDNNSLMLLPHLRDDYSLKIISKHLAQLYSINMKYENKYSYLFIERCLQVVGEFLKCKDKTLHLQYCTEALVKAEISVEVVNDLKALRNLLCRAKNGELLKRIEAEANNSHIFDLILEELLYVKKKIDEVIKVHKPIVQRELIQNALCILNNRVFEMPENVAHVHYNVINSVLQFPIDFIRHKTLTSYYERFWAPEGHSKPLMTEVSMLAIHSTKLLSDRTRAIKNIHNKATIKLPFYTERIKSSLKIILSCKERWRQIITALKEENTSIDLLDYPNEIDATKMKSHSRRVLQGCNSLVQPLEIHKLIANVEYHWKFIENLLHFIVKKTRVFDNTIEELKFSIYTFKLKELSKYNYKTNDMEKNVIQYLEMMRKKLNDMNIGRNSSLFRYSIPSEGESVKIREFPGINKFTCLLRTANVLIEEEKTNLINSITKTVNENNIKSCCAINSMINNIKTDTVISKTEYTKFTQLINLENKSQKILLNLVMGHTRNPLLPQCLSKRVFILSEIIKEQSANELVLRYKLDKTFRVLLEVLLFDIFIIMKCSNNSNLLKKKNKLLTEINLRNLLIHGSPLLEVVGNILDANDLPTELITKALEFVEDRKSIDALCTLIELGIDFTRIDVRTLNLEQRELVNKFKVSHRWKDYLNLLPEYKQNVYEKQKKTPKLAAISIELREAVKKKEPNLVQDCIDKGANVNFIDDYKKAMIHYAAMSGSVNILKVLLEKKADINIVNNESNLTALHYSAMNNLRGSVEFLLENGADCFALDNKGRTPVYWASQRNHVNICRILVQAMKTSI